MANTVAMMGSTLSGGPPGPLIGYDVTNGQPVYLKPHHTVVTGLTQESGKTTGIHGFCSRWKGKKILVLLGKRGESAFSGTREIRPFLRPRKVSWRYVESLIDVTLQEKNKILRSTIMRVCSGQNTLEDVHANVRKELDRLGGREGFVKSMLVQLDEYFKIIIPEQKSFNFSSVLDLTEGITVMPLYEFTVPMRQMILDSIAIEIMAEMMNVVLIIPEAWELLPNQQASPAKASVEHLVRKGAVLGNFLVLDSQDLVGIDASIRKPFSNYLLGKQQEQNEVERSLAAIPLPRSTKPKAEDIMTLNLGQFITVIAGKVRKVFAIPSWMDLNEAKKFVADPEAVYKIRRPSTSLDVDYKAELAQSDDLHIVSRNEIASLKAQLEQSDKRIRELQDKVTTLENSEASLIDLVEQRDLELKEYLSLAESFRKLIFGRSDAPDGNDSEFVMPVPEDCSEMTVNTRMNKVNVVEHLENQSVTDQDLKGRLLVLVAHRYFKKPLTLQEVHALYDSEWGCSPSQKPGAHNGSKFQKDLQSVLDEISVRPYAYLIATQQDGKKTFVENPGSLNRLSTTVSLSGTN